MIKIKTNSENIKFIFNYVINNSEIEKFSYENISIEAEKLFNEKYKKLKKAERDKLLKEIKEFKFLKKENFLIPSNMEIIPITKILVKLFSFTEYLTMQNDPEYQEYKKIDFGIFAIKASPDIGAYKFISHSPKIQYSKKSYAYLFE